MTPPPPVWKIEKCLAILEVKGLSVSLRNFEEGFGSDMPTLKIVIGEKRKFRRIPIV